MLHYKAAAIGFAFLARFANAFTPVHPALKKVELIRDRVENEYLQMVAGGAAAGKEEYYEGMHSIRSNHRISVFHFCTTHVHASLIYLCTKAFA